MTVAHTKHASGFDELEDHGKEFRSFRSGSLVQPVTSEYSLPIVRKPTYRVTFELVVSSLLVVLRIGSKLDGNSVRRGTNDREW